MKVNKAIYVIVALFLGGLGIHKFYADKFGQGLFHLLFFWTGIPTIISIIHAIFVIFTKKADKVRNKLSGKSSHPTDNKHN